MAAVKSLLAAEDHFAAVYAIKTPKRTSRKRLAELMEIRAQARASLEQNRVALRQVHTEIIREEYGP